MIWDHNLKRVTNLLNTKIPLRCQRVSLNILDMYKLVSMQYKTIMKNLIIYKFKVQHKTNMKIKIYRWFIQTKRLMSFVFSSILPSRFRLVAMSFEFIAREEKKSWKQWKKERQEKVVKGRRGKEGNEVDAIIWKLSTNLLFLSKVVLFFVYFHK